MDAGLRVRRLGVLRCFERRLSPGERGFDQRDEADHRGQGVIGADLGHDVLVPHGNAVGRVGADRPEPFCPESQDIDRVPHVPARRPQAGLYRLGGVDA